MVLEGHTGPPDTTSRTTLDDVVPDGDIGALATTVRTRSRTAQGPATCLGTTTTPPSRTPSWPTTAGPLSKASTSIPRTMTRASGTLSDHQRWSSTCRKMQPPGHTASPAFGRQCHNRYRNQTYTPGPTKPQTPTQEEHGPPQQGHSPTAHERAEPHNAIATVQQLDKPLTSRHVPDHYQLPGGGNHTRSTASTWRLPMGIIDWKKILPGITAMEAMHLLTPHQVKPTQAMHLFKTTQGHGLH